MCFIYLLDMLFFPVITFLPLWKLSHNAPGFLSFVQVRIEQVIVAEPGAVLLYKLSNLLKFYHHTIRYGRIIL